MKKNRNNTHTEIFCCSGENSSYRDGNSVQPNQLYTCPMHPEIQQQEPGSCPICGMSLELMVPSATMTDEQELHDLSFRFWISAVLSIPLLVVNMGGHLFSIPWLVDIINNPLYNWGQFLIASPVVIWGGWLFWQKAWMSLRNAHLNMFTLIGLGVGVAYSYSTLILFLSYIQANVSLQDVYFEPAALITTLVLLGQVLELKARTQTNKAIQQLLELTPTTAIVIQDDGVEEEMDLSRIQIGHLIRIRPGDRIPVDGIVTQGNSTLNESMITGEPISIEKSAGDSLIAGTTNINGLLIMRAERVGQETLLSQIVTLVSKAQRTKAPIQRLADEISAYFVPFVVFFSLIAALVWYVWGPEPRLSHALIIAVSVLIIACPCALGLATPLSIMVGTGRGARDGILIKDASALETLSRINILVVDKTGTLTEGKPKVKNIIPLVNINKDTLLLYAASLEKGSEHPLAAAILQEATRQNLSLKDITGFESISGRGVQGIIDGLFVAVGNRSFMESLKIDMTAEEKNLNEYQKNGQGIVFVSIDREFRGVIIISDVIKESARPALEAFQQQDIDVVMLTGDNEFNSKAIAQNLGISKVKAGVLPAEKYDYICQLQREGRVVAMVGDGVNDAPALAQANVSIAMGTGTGIAMESAGVTLMSGDLQGLVKAHQLSIATMKNIKQNLILAFGYNALAIPIAAGFLYPVFGILLSPVIASIAMSLSSVSVILNAIRLAKR